MISEEPAQPDPLIKWGSKLLYGGLALTAVSFLLKIFHVSMGADPLNVWLPQGLGTGALLASLVCRHQAVYSLEPKGKFSHALRQAMKEHNIVVSDEDRQNWERSRNQIPVYFAFFAIGLLMLPAVMDQNKPFGLPQMMAVVCVVAGMFGMFAVFAMFKSIQEKYALVAKSNAASKTSGTKGEGARAVSYRVTLRRKRLKLGFEGMVLGAFVMALSLSAAYGFFGADWGTRLWNGLLSGLPLTAATMCAFGFVIGFCVFLTGAFVLNVDVSPPTLQRMFGNFGEELKAWREEQNGLWPKWEEPQASGRTRESEDDIVLPEHWDERSIAGQFLRLRDRPNVLTHYMDSIIDRFVMRQDEQTARARIHFLRAQLEQLKLTKEFLVSVDDLQLHALEREIRKRELELKRSDLENRQKRQDELEAMRHKLEIAELTKKIHDLENPPAPPQASPLPSAEEKKRQEEERRKQKYDEVKARMDRKEKQKREEMDKESDLLKKRKIQALHDDSINQDFEELKKWL